jgi:hypothetical protein
MGTRNSKVGLTTPKGMASSAVKMGRMYSGISPLFRLVDFAACKRGLGSYQMVPVIREDFGHFFVRCDAGLGANSYRN